MLSGVVAGLMAGASAVGLWRTGLYQDPAPVAATLRGYDLVALLVSPVLAGAVAVAPQIEGRAELLSASVLAYAAYHYAGYVFGAAFNALFLAHVAVFGLSVAALVLTLRSLVRGDVGSRRPRCRLVARGLHPALSGRLQGVGAASRAGPVRTRR